MVNLGDRAYHVGLHELISGHLGHRIIMGPVKALPYLTRRKTARIRSTDDARELLGSWLTAATRRRGPPSPAQARLQRSLEGNYLTRTRMFQRADEAVRRRFARGILETLSPYVFRRRFVNALVDKIEQADVVVFNGGAFVADHLDKYLPMVLFELYLAKQLGKRTAVVNQTVAVRRPHNRALVSFVYSRLDAHFVREPRSKAVLEEMGVAADRVHLSCDAAFGIRVPEARSGSQGLSGQVGICVRGDRSVRSEFWANVARRLAVEHGKTPVFFFTSRYQDWKAFEQIRRHYPGCTFLDFCDYPELIERLRHLDFIITDRYHATIFAILAETPFITLDSNTFKTRGLMDMVDFSVDVMRNDGDIDLMARNIAYVCANREHLSRQLHKARLQLSNFARTSLEAL